MERWLAAHRGPFRLCITRPAKKPGPPLTSEWLPGEKSDRDEVEAEARALLADKKDSICSVHVWSVREEQFVGGFK